MVVKKNRAAKKAKRVTRRGWSKADVRDLKAHSKLKTAVTKISKTMKRTSGAVRQQAFKLGLPLGHRR